jgi:hypothetical protein
MVEVVLQEQVEQTELQEQMVHQVQVGLQGLQVLVLRLMFIYQVVVTGLNLPMLKQFMLCVLPVEVPVVEVEEVLQVLSVEEEEVEAVAV